MNITINIQTHTDKETSVDQWREGKREGTHGSRELRGTNLQTIMHKINYHKINYYIAQNREYRASLLAQTVKRLPAMQETWVQSLGREDPPEKAMATHSSTLAWKSPWTEQPGRLQSMGLQRVRYD